MADTTTDTPDDDSGGLVLYDGVCALCNSTVRFLLERDKRGVLRFAPLQGETAGGIWERYPGRDPGLKTMVYVRGFGSGNEEIHVRSRAVLEILNDIGGAWRVSRVGRLIPAGLRDALYDWIARNRYAWFGRYETCRLPGEGETERFLP